MGVGGWVGGWGGHGLPRGGWGVGGVCLHVPHIYIHWGERASERASERMRER